MDTDDDLLASSSRLRQFVVEGDYDGTEEEFNADIIRLCNAVEGVND